ncbi:MAG: hypothetical protein NC181_02005 [Clostridium sp.]|nr:hypothetical protein [Clostridium sp.]
MRKKIIDIIVDIVIYYLSALLISFIFMKFGWIEGNIYLYSLALTIGWTIGKLIISFFRKEK